MSDKTISSVPLRYTRIAIGLHWLSAALVLALLGIGLAMTQLDLAPLPRFQLYQLHKSIGITALLLSLVRLGWRLSHRPPALSAQMPTLERRAAQGAHGLLYGLIIGLPLVGWAMVSASPYNIATVLYGLVSWPHLPMLPELANRAAVESALKLAHAWGAWFLLGLCVLHIAAALRHHWILRDDTLRRILPWVSHTVSKDQPR